MKLWGPYSAFGLSAALLAAAGDQLFKLWMIGLLEVHKPYPIPLYPFFDLVMAWNCGISWSLLKQDSEAGRWALVALSVSAVIALIGWLAQLHSRFLALSLGLIIGGAVGNVADRIRVGAVADFFYFHISWFQFPVFNLADVAISAGVAGLLLDVLAGGHKGAGKQA